MMLKKILLVISMVLLSFNTVFAQDMSEILALLEDENALNDIDIAAAAALFDDDTPATDENGDPILVDGVQITAGEALKKTIDDQIAEMVESGQITQELADTTSSVVTTIDELDSTDPTVTDGYTLSEALTASGTDLTTVKTAIVDVVAVMAAKTLLDDPSTGQQIKDGIHYVDGILNTLTKFGAATAQSSMTSSLFGHQGYHLFAASLGVSLSGATNYDSIDFLLDSSNYENLLENMLAQEGLAAGVNFQSITASAGINLGFLVPRLYGGAVFGMTSAKVDASGFNLNMFGQDIPISGIELPQDTIDQYGLQATISTAVIGGTVNYQLVKPKGIPVLFRWNGFSLGSGFIFSSFDIDATIDLATTLSNMDPNDDIDMDPESLMATFLIDTNTYTIPLEISTGIQLLSAVNLNFGLGANINFNNSKTTLRVYEGNNEEEPSLGTQLIQSVMYSMFEEEGLDLENGIDQPVDFAQLKAMVGLGIGLGPATFNVNIGAFTDGSEDLGATASLSVVVRI